MSILYLDKLVFVRDGVLTITVSISNQLDYFIYLHLFTRKALIIELNKLSLVRVQKKKLLFSFHRSFD